MKILVTGKGSAGSWNIRGVQLGGAIGAKVVPKAPKSACEDADLIICVKRINHPFFNAVAASKRPWIWDLVDFYPQPDCTGWDRAKAIGWVQAQIERFKPTAVIWPNQRMRDDCDTGLPGAVIYHHHRPGSPRNPIRETVKRIGYEGEPRYLDEWMRAFGKECAARKWDFILNPLSIADLDAVVAVRGAKFNGYAQFHWKSNVKLSNAQGSGTPIIAAKEPSYLETSDGGVVWVDGIEDVSQALGQIVSRETREKLAGHLCPKAYSLDAAAQDLRKFIKKLSEDNLCGAS